MEETDDNWTTKASDVAIESVVLQQVLDLHPTHVTVAELVREISGGRVGFGERDAIERAIRELAGTGLLHRGELVIPTRAALRFSELMDR
jgi:hypothetical protein